MFLWFTKHLYFCIFTCSAFTTFLCQRTATSIRIHSWLLFCTTPISKGDWSPNMCQSRWSYHRWASRAYSRLLAVVNTLQTQGHILCTVPNVFWRLFFTVHLYFLSDSWVQPMTVYCTLLIAFFTACTRVNPSFINSIPDSIWSWSQLLSITFHPFCFYLQEPLLEPPPW